MIEQQTKFKDLDLDKQYAHVLKDFISKRRKFFNFTKNYHLSDNLKDKSFNLRFNEKSKLQELFDKQHNYTDEFYNALHTRVLNKDHIVIVFFGHTNSGKSWAAISIAEVIKRLFLQELKNDSTLFLSFSDSEYRQKVPKMHEKDIMIRDETPDLTGKGTRTIQKNLKNVLAITRAGQYCFLFISPDNTIVKSNAVSFYLESAGINKIKEDSRFVLYDNNLTPLGRIFIKKPKDGVFLKDYEQKKSSNIKELMKSAGGVGYSPDMGKLTTQIKVFTKYCRENGIKTKGEIKSQIHFFNEEYPDLKITTVAGEDDDIVNNVSILLKKEEKIKKKKDKIKEISRIYSESKDFKFDMNTLNDVIQKQAKWRNVERDLQIYNLYMNEEITQTELAERYPDLSSGQAANAIINKVRGLTYQCRGKLFEEQFYTYLKEKYNNNPDTIIKYDGANEKPDILIINKKLDELCVLSLKCLDLPREVKKYPYYIKWRNSKHVGGFEPEINYAGKHISSYKIVNVFIIICSANTGIVKSIPFNIQHKVMVKLMSEF